MFNIIFTVSLCFVIGTHGFLNIIPRVLDDISTHRDLHHFAQLLRDNENARRLLRNREVTIFAPTDSALQDFRGTIDESLLLYHIVPIGLTLDGLSLQAEKRQALQSVDDRLPTLWFTDVNSKLFVNQAEVLSNDSNHQSRTRDDTYGKIQVVHKISKVLQPLFNPGDVGSNSLGHPPTGYDLLAQVGNWPSLSYTLGNYYKRVILTDSVPLYKDSVEGWTFLIPANELRSSMTDSDITKEAIRCSIIPRVVFSDLDIGKPTNKTYPTLGPDCRIVFHPSKTLETQDTITGRFKTLKILLGDIPLKNGVAHIVDQMPGVFKPRMSPVFPIRTLWQQIENDYYLQKQTDLMSDLRQTALLRNDHLTNLTVFAVWDQDWERFLTYNRRGFSDLLHNKKLDKFLLRHISEGLYDIKRLVEVSRTSLRGESVLLGLGDEKIIAKFTEENGEVVIYWGTTRIRVLKSNIKCTNGLIHIIDRPFIFDVEVKDEEYNLIKLWKMVSSVMY